MSGAVILDFPKSGISKGVVAAIVLGAVAVAIIISALVSILIMRRRAKKYGVLRNRQCKYCCGIVKVVHNI